MFVSQFVVSQEYSVSFSEQSSGDSASVLIPLFENDLVEDEDDDDNVIIDQDKRVGEQDDDDLNAPNERSNQLYPWSSAKCLLPTKLASSWL